MSKSTLVLTIDPDEPDPSTLDAAAIVLTRGGLVAFATETVYGLGADATNPEAVARIFEAKGRPSNNPLIVHADGPDMARSCVADWPPIVDKLAGRFWPGPLTLVLPRASIIPDVVTAGGETVGVRVPQPKVARGLIERTGRPVAAPSANRSTGVSPTLASHVLNDLDGKIDLILDSGPTPRGLESTVLDLTTVPPRLLRPGPISRAQLARHVGEIATAATSDPGAGPLPSPGLLAIHYAPRSPAVRVEADRLAGFPWPEHAAAVVVGRSRRPIEIPEHVTRIDLPAPRRAAAALYATLHDLDARGLAVIVIVPPPDEERWRTVRDRIWRATRPVDGAP